MFDSVLNSPLQPSIIFLKVLTICLLNLINIIHQVIQYFARSNPRDLMFNTFAE